MYIGRLFFIGIDYGFAFVGQYIGRLFFESSRPGWFKWILLPVSFVLGAAITVSEPAVTVLGNQMESLTNGHISKRAIRITLALGIGVASLLSVFKILTQINILYLLVPLYAISIAMMKYSPTLFVGLAYDSGGVTGGALTSAFLTPLTLSIAQVSRSVPERNVHFSKTASELLHLFRLHLDLHAGAWYIYDVRSASSRAGRRSPSTSSPSIWTRRRSRQTNLPIIRILLLAVSPHLRGRLKAPQALSHRSRTHLRNPIAPSTVKRAKRRSFIRTLPQ